MRIKLLGRRRQWFLDKGEDSLAEFQKAKQSGKPQVYKGKTKDGEPIMAVTTVIYNQNGLALGAYRWITSMQAANKMMYGVTSLVILICSILHRE